MRRLAAIAVALTVALALSGIGFALWSETLIFDGTVNTGVVDWRFDSYSVRDTFAPPPMSGPGTIGDWTCDPGFTRVRQLDKNVAWGSCTPSADGHTLDFELHNVYPCYFNAIDVYPVNTGTIPIHIERVRIKDNNGVVRAEYTKVPAPIAKLDLNDDGLADIEILWGDNFGAQLHPGDPPVEISMWVHVLQECPQGAELNFSVEIEAVQWNESIHPFVP